MLRTKIYFVTIHEEFKLGTHLIGFLHYVFYTC